MSRLSFEGEGVIAIRLPVDLDYAVPILVLSPATLSPALLSRASNLVGGSPQKIKSITIKIE